MAFATSAYPAAVAISAVNSDGRPVRSSGVIVGPHTILMSQHGLDNRQTGYAANSFSIGPLKETDTFVSSARGDQVLVSLIGTSNGADYVGTDFALLHTSVDLTRYATPMSIGTATPGTAVHATGYPASVPSLQQDVISTISSVDAANRTLTFTNSDIRSGNSGGPIWYSTQSGQQVVVGLVQGGDLASTVFGVAFTPSLTTTLNGYAAWGNTLFSNGKIPVNANQSVPSLPSRLQIGDLSKNTLTGDATRELFVPDQDTNTVINGGAGFDTVALGAGTYSSYRISSVISTGSGANMTVTSPTNVSYTLTNVERLQFSDGVLDFRSANSNPFAKDIANQTLVVSIGAG